MESDTFMKQKPFQSFLIIMAITLLSCAVMAETPEPEQSTDGLRLVKKDSHGELWVTTNADWNRFTQIKLERATVEFSKNWARDQKNRMGNRPTEENMDRIKSDLSELLDEVFRQELTADDGFVMSDASGENVMRITPRIVNLNINAPDRMRDHIGYSLADSKGSMTLELDIHDSVSGTLLAQMVDSRVDPQHGYMEWANSGTNRRAARFMFIRWAGKLYDLLEEARLSPQD
jgi:hypothetical protein